MRTVPNTPGVAPIIAAHFSLKRRSGGRDTQSMAFFRPARDGGVVLGLAMSSPLAAASRSLSSFTGAGTPWASTSPS